MQDLMDYSVYLMSFLYFLGEIIDWFKERKSENWRHGIFVCVLLLLRKG
jgi:hypothetical protein